ncbi:MAG: pirin family protein [Actinobacteria bacterium]|nr:pirin family protein [Actinomycetota bacterium]
MSGFLPVDAQPFECAGDSPHECEMEVIDGTVAKVGAFEVQRVLPRRAKRTIGHWCFVDHMGPGTVSDEIGLDVAPHPHIGLQTVTWLAQGAILHRDSLGTEQVIRPGQLNLMTAGHGVAHSEETVGLYSGPLHGMQLWLSLPPEVRNTEPAFEHHADLPRLELDGGAASVILGTLGEVSSPARLDSAVVAAELRLRSGRTVVPLDPTFEYGIVVVEGPAVAVGAGRLGGGQMGYLGLGRDEVSIEAAEATTVLLIGGVPRVEPLVMWWNYVAPSRAEIIEAHAQWADGDERFGVVHSPLERLVPPGPPWPA